MILSTPSLNLGRRVFGVAALAFGVIALAWHDSGNSHQLRYIFYAASVALIFGGGTILFDRTAKTGAAALTAAYLALALLCVPGIIAAPKIYNSWGNFFEQFSLLLGAAMAYAGSSARSSSAWPREATIRIGRIFLGVCVTSFTLEQAFYLDATAHLVPKWLPPSQMFWAVATSALFALAAAALLTNRMAILATRMLTMMLVIFGLFVWIPLIVRNPHDPTTWSETAETFEITGAVWILASLLSEDRVTADRPW